MSFEIIQDHLVTREQYLSWDRWDQGHLHALCGYDVNKQWAETQNLGRVEEWTPYLQNPDDCKLCLTCLEHPDYVLAILGDLP